MSTALVPHADDNHIRRQCTAKRKRDGKRCTQTPIRGGTVCRMHGGGAPQVKRAAQERLKALVDPAIVALQEIVSDVKHPQRLAAAREILERDGRIGEPQAAAAAAGVTWEEFLVIFARRQSGGSE